MWNANHHDWCKNNDQYLIIETIRVIQDSSGCVINDCHLDPQLVHAKCASCGADGTWVPYEVS